MLTESEREWVRKAAAKTASINVVTILWLSRLLERPPGDIQATLEQADADVESLL